MAMTYASYVTTMAGILSIQPETVLTTDNPELLEAMIAYAELRIYRELDLLHTVTEAQTSDLTPGTRSVAVPGNIFIVNSASLITPASTAAAAGTRVPLQRVSVEFMNFAWPTAATTGVPSFYALQDEDDIILAPTPAAAYRLAVVGIFRPAPLSSGNTSTFLTDNMPDLFVAASAIWGFGAINADFGAQSENPQSAQSWEAQYQALKAGVDGETLRQKAWGTQWQPWSPSPAARESRT